MERRLFQDLVAAALRDGRDVVRATLGDARDVTRRRLGDVGGVSGAVLHHGDLAVVGHEGPVAGRGIAGDPSARESAPPGAKFGVLL